MMVLTAGGGGGPATPGGSTATSVWRWSDDRRRSSDGGVGPTVAADNSWSKTPIDSKHHHTLILFTWPESIHVLSSQTHPFRTPTPPSSPKSTTSAGDGLGSMASTSGSKLPESAAQPPTAAPSAAARECESCRSAPGIPFCRVEWSFLCTGCAAVVHGNNCVVSVTPNPNANFPHFPYYPFPYPYPYPFANPSSDPNAVVHLSSDEDDLSPADGQGRGWRQIPGRVSSYRRMESVMRYREKRKSRKFEKTVRYENRRAYAEVRPRLDGKFASSKGGHGKEMTTPLDVVDEVVESVVKDGTTSMGFIGMGEVSVRAEAGGELEGLVAGGVELGQPDFIEDVRFQ